MKFLHTADWHAGKTLRNRSRIAELNECINEIASIAEEETTDVILVAGDLFDGAAPFPDAEQVVYRGLLRLAETGAKVVVIAGNHDNPSRLRAVAPLLEHVMVKTGSHVLRPQEGGVIKVSNRKSTEVAEIALIPFMSQRQLVRAQQIMEEDASQYTVKYADGCSDVIARLCSGMDPDSVRVAMAHLHISGGLLGGGERLAHTIDQYHVPGQAFPALLHYVALGHLHAPQKIAGPCPIFYSGSPLQLDFGEVEIKNSVFLVEASADKPAIVTPRELRSGMKLKTLKGPLEQLGDSATEFENCYLKLVLDDDPVVGLADRAREAFPNAVEVLLKKAVSANQSADLDYQGMTPQDLFELYLKEQGETDVRVLEAFKELAMEAYATQEA